MATTQTIECSAGPCSVTVELAPAPPSTDNLADIGAVFALFLGAAAVIYMAKLLLRFFSVGPHDD